MQRMIVLLVLVAAAIFGYRYCETSYAPENQTVTLRKTASE